MTVDVPLCWDCDHCKQTGEIIRVAGKRKELRHCTLHDIPCGASSATCEQATNKPVRKQRPAAAKPTTTGWEDY